MIPGKMIRKYFFLAVGIVLMFVLLSFFLTDLVARNIRSNREFKQRQNLPPIFMAKTIDNLQFKTKLEAVKSLVSWHEDNNGPSFTLLNDKAEILYSSAEEDRELPAVERLSQLVKPYDYFYLNGDGFFNGPPPGAGFFGGPGGPPPGRPGGPPPEGMDRRPPPPRREMPTAVIRLMGEPAQYLVIGPPNFKNSTIEKDFNPRTFQFLGMGSLFLSLLIGIGVTLLIIYLSVNKKINEADGVISQIQSGNLKARFKIAGNNEFSEAMVRFNTMADEIEKLVEHLRFVELARTKLLQELAHDLRTPIASMKSLLETLETKHSQLTPEVRQELLTLSGREIEYFGKLVEDLLLLSQVSEPHYSTDTEKIDISEIVTEEVEDQNIKNRNSDHKIDFKVVSPGQKIEISGNRVLFLRMLKNVFNNAVSFARQQLKVTISLLDAHHFEIVIDDDGPGFTDEQIKQFGSRKMSRQIIAQKDSKGGRLSIGLGSVVIKKICQLHRGDVSVENRLNEAGKVIGARVKLRFSLV